MMNIFHLEVEPIYCCSVAKSILFQSFIDYEENFASSTKMFLG